jgi:uncharacterized protein (DUF486 family)
MGFPTTRHPVGAVLIRLREFDIVAMPPRRRRHSTSRADQRAECPGLFFPANPFNSGSIGGYEGRRVRIGAARHALAAGRAAGNASSPPPHAEENRRSADRNGERGGRALLLICSNVFMTFAWYAHLKDMNGRPWFLAALVSWGVALAEYLLQVPANRIGYTAMNLGQLKILQEVIALSVFVPFAVLYMKQPLKLNYLWAALCICAAVYFVFRDS